MGAVSALPEPTAHWMERPQPSLRRPRWRRTRRRAHYGARGFYLVPLVGRGWLRYPRVTAHEQGRRTWSTARPRRRDAVGLSSRYVRRRAIRFGSRSQQRDLLLA